MASDRRPFFSVFSIIFAHDCRTKWKRGRVESLLIRRDGIVRGAVLRTYQENGKTILIKRVLQRLIPLEITSNQLDDEQLPPELVKLSVS